MSKDGEDGEETRSLQGDESFPLRLPRDERRRPVVWTVAGFDPSNGAGITADLTTFGAHGFFGCSAITALTAQSTLGVFGWQAVAPDLLRETLQRLHEDVPAAGIKIGMLGTPETAEVVAAFLKGAGVCGASGPVIVYDPVLRSSSGRDLFPASGLPALQGALLPCVDWITPNWPELGLLSGHSVHDLASAETAARALIARHPGLTVVATGGDQEQPTDLLVAEGEGVIVLKGQRVATSSTHGTGCAFSSALLARLAAGSAPVDAVRGAKSYVEGALRHAPGLGQGRGPMGLLWTLEEEKDARSVGVATLER